MRNLLDTFAYLGPGSLEYPEGNERDEKSERSERSERSEQGVVSGTIEQMSERREVKMQDYCGFRGKPQILPLHSL